MIACFGGGKGLSSTATALKLKKKKFWACVSTIDNGGSTGLLRKEYGIPAVGDFRRVIDSLSSSPLAGFMESRRSGHAIGNLAILEFIRVNGFAKGVSEYARAMGVNEKIIPQFTEPCDIFAIVSGKKVLGETEIDSSEGAVNGMGFAPEVEVNPEAVELAEKSETAILGPGSLYTSVLPHLLSKELLKAIKQASEIIFIPGISNDVKLLDSFGVAEHLREIEKYVRPTKVLAQSPPVGLRVNTADERIVKADIALNEYLHDPRKLGDALCRIL
jgi:uncharacterized cofD-like protein